MGKSILEDPNGNSKLGVEARKENKEHQNAILVEAITGGFAPYAKKVAKLSDGEELSKPEQEYLDRMERWIGYKFPKLAAVDNKTALTGNITINLKHNGD